MAICDICMAELDPGCYSEMMIKTRSGSLAPTVTRSLGYLCESCTERFDEGLAGGVPMMPRDSGSRRLAE